MSLAALALKGAIHARLAADAGLAALVPAGRILDRAPQGLALPFVLHGTVRSDDYSSATEAGEEHVFSIEVWADAAGQAEALTAAARIAALLDDAALPLAKGRLVSLDHRFTRTRRDLRSRAVVAELQFRAVTEG